eukprot:COSAG02_NODE_4057_length_5845_cov_8.300557_7_plen_51_part_00
MAAPSAHLRGWSMAEAYFAKGMSVWVLEGSVGGEERYGGVIAALPGDALG